jgi:NDP-sugar pyrophosphorylase family protein
MTAVILAGGLGTRLRSAVPDKPKVLAEVCGRPFVEYVLDHLAREGVRKVVLCIGYMGEMVQQRLGGSYRKMMLRYSHETVPLGTGGALRLALPMLESDPVLVLNGDSYCDTRLKAFADWHTARESRATILLAEADDTRRHGRVQVDPEGRVLEFSEKSQAQGPGWINAGIYLLNHETIEPIETGRPVSMEREFFPGMIGRGLHGFRTEGQLWDIGVPDAYARAIARFTSSITR